MKTPGLSWADWPVLIPLARLLPGAGLPLSLRDRKAAALRILTMEPETSDRAVAAKTGLSDKTVVTIRRRLGAEIPRSDTRRNSAGLDGVRVPGFTGTPGIANVPVPGVPLPALPSGPA
jgi:hypothetical protein